MRVLSVVFGLAACLLGNVGLAASAAPILLPLPAQNPQAQNQLFALGYALQLPAAQSRIFLADVKALQYADADDVNAPTAATLAREAKLLRAAEIRCYQFSAKTLRAMAAPPNVLTWADGTAHLLERPQIVSDEAKPYVKTDPDTASILATIDEAEAVKIIADRASPSLQAWLKLSRGGAGVWAQQLWRLAAGMSMAASADVPFLLPRSTVQHLRLTAPPGTPLEVLHTLSALAPRGKGNLAYLVQPSDVSVEAAQIGAPTQTLLDGYGAAQTASLLAPPPK